MRNIFLALFIAFGALFSAQNMSEKDFVQKAKRIIVSTDYQELSVLEQDFLKNRNSDESQWKSYYYAALSCVCKARIQFDNESLDSTYRELDYALKYLSVADLKMENNVEVKALLGITYLLGAKFNHAKKDIFMNKASDYSTIVNKLSIKNRRAVLLSDLLSGFYGRKEVQETESELSISWGRELLGGLMNKK